VLIEENHFSARLNRVFLLLETGFYMLMAGRNHGYNEATALNKGIFSGQRRFSEIPFQSIYDWIDENHKGISPDPNTTVK
jgi:hypothetical protein